MAGEPVEQDGAAAERVRTGLEDVDAVITAVEQLEERPIEEHVGVFETAHEQLRRALDAEPGDRSSDRPTDQPPPS